MNKLSLEEQTRIVKCLVEGNSIRSTVRMTGVAKNTIQKLLLNLGHTCEEYQKEHFINLTTRRVQCDEIWAFCYAKEKNLPKELKQAEGFGDVWTFTALDSETKLIISWYMGDRSTDNTWEFIDDLKGRFKHRVQLTTDGFKPYIEAVEDAFAGEIDYGIVKKTYDTYRNSKNPAGYSPSLFVKAQKKKIIGKPDKALISTSHVERANLTMRMSMRRFTRLTNAFSKKFANMKAAVALHFMYYNFCRIHQTLRVTPAMEAKLTNHVWEISELLKLTEIKAIAA